MFQIYIIRGRGWTAISKCCLDQTESGAGINGGADTRLSLPTRQSRAALPRTVRIELDCKQMDCAGFFGRPPDHTSIVLSPNRATPNAIPRLPPTYSVLVIFIQGCQNWFLLHNFPGLLYVQDALQDVSARILFVSDFKKVTVAIFLSAASAASPG